MPILATDLLLVHRDGVDYNASATNFQVKGQKGAPGPDGAKGEEGPQGEAATLLHFMGDVANEAALPGDADVGDVYRALDTGDYWAMSDSGWVDITEEMSGTEGPEGEKGAKGNEGPKGGKGEPADFTDVTTSGVSLTNPSGGRYFNLPMAAEDLPPMIGLFTQEDYNKWIHSAIVYLAENLGINIPDQPDGGSAAGPGPDDNVVVIPGGSATSDNAVNTMDGGSASTSYG